MKNQKLQRTRLLSLVLTMVMLLSTLPSTVYATGGDNSPNTTGLTECHQNHDADCGYTEAVEGTVCLHLNEDGSSSCTPVVSDAESTTPETPDTGYTCDHTDGCGYTEAVPGVDCTHALLCDTFCVEEDTNYTVTEVGGGIFAGRFSHFQVFDCWRTPATPEAGKPLKVYSLDAPFNDVAGDGTRMNRADIEGKIFYFKPTADGANTYFLYIADDVDGTNETRVSRGGGIYALGKEGFLFITTQGSSKGYFISLSQGFNYGEEFTYTPTEGGPISADTAASMPGISSTPWNPEESFAVVFDSNGADADKEATPSQISVRKDQASTPIGDLLPSPPERTGWNFDGWNTQADGNGIAVDSETVLTGDITVYAQWKQREAQNFEITTPPKDEYTYGDSFDPEALVITVTYDDGSEELIAYGDDESKFEFSLGTTDKLQITDNIVTITYKEDGVTLYKELTISVSKREVTPKVTGVSDKEYDGTTSTTNGHITLENVVEGDDVDATASSIIFVNKDVGTDKAVDVNSIELSGTAKDNYILSTDSLSDAETTAEITPFATTITWGPNPATFIYDGTEQGVTATISSNLFAGDTCEVTVEDGSKTTPGTYTAKATLTNGNYALQGANSTYQFIINEATIAGITVIPTDKIYDGEYDDGVTVTGQKETDDVSYSTDGGLTWSDAVPQVKLAGSSTDIWVRVTREHHKPYFSEKVTAKVQAVPTVPTVLTVKIENPTFDETDVKKVTVGGIVTLGDNPATTQTFEIREVGTTNWIPLNEGTENGKVTTYKQLLDNLAENKEYELRLTVIDSANITATATLKFRTKMQAPAAGGIIGSVDGSTGTGTITVTLEMGNTVVASVKGLSNKDEFTFSNLADGEYNVVATDTSGRRVTMMATVKNGTTTRLAVMIVGQQQSSVEVKGNTPPVAVDGLQGLFSSGTYTSDQDAIDAIAANGTVEIRLTASEATAQSEIDDIKSHVGRYIISVLVDLKVDMIITPPDNISTVKNLKNVDELLTIAVPLPADAIGKISYKMYRHHNDTVETLKQIQMEADKAEGTFLIDGKYAYIYSNKFSTYAITYANSTGGGGSDDDSDNGNGGNGGGGGNGKPNVVTPPVVEKPTVITPPVVEKPTPDTTGVADLLVTEQHVKYMAGDEKGNFNPTSNMTRAEVAQMFYNLMIDKNVEKTASFNDVADSAWYAEAVNTLASMNILKGSDGNFRPAESITRGEFAAIAGRFAKIEKGNCTFSDVDKSLWSYSAIAATSSYGWITGYADNTFRPEEQILRAEVVVIVNNMLGRTPDKEYIDANKASLKSFTDTADPSYWAWYHIVEATNAHAHTFDQKEEKWTSLK